ncbi:VOC family protein [uncultured Rhodospira sp.]|uniref:VOC family protein n=1 Tax=uncultured Rhodospira sp. TaxID=1936189 RepID=UPI0026328940|nr:VOC family protein [uncultured Rhodospira sp.]
MSHPHAEFCWTELMTRDLDGAKAFYAATLGWTFTPHDDAGTYWVAHKDDRPVAGLFLMEGEAFDSIPDHWFCYIGTDDLEATLKKARAAGAQVLREPFEAAGYRMVILRDAAGAAIGFSQDLSESA